MFSTFLFFGLEFNCQDKLNWGELIASMDDLVAIKLVGDKVSSVSCGHQRLETWGWCCTSFASRGRVGQWPHHLLQHQGGGTANLLASNSGVFYHCGAGRIMLSIWMSTWGQLGWPTWLGLRRWVQKGGLVPDKRDLVAMEEQDEGSILYFCRKWKFL